VSRLLVAAPPFAGHLYPLIAIAKRLRDQGHDVRFATAPGAVPLLHRLDFPVDPLLADDPTVLERIGNTDEPVGNSPLRLVTQLRQNLAILPEALAELQTMVDRQSPDAVIADFTAPVAGWAAERAGIGWITTIPTPFAIENRRGTPSYCGGWSEPTKPWHRVRDAAGRLAVHTFKSLWVSPSADSSTRSARASTAPTAPKPCTRPKPSSASDSPSWSSTATGQRRSSSSAPSRSRPSRRRPRAS